jgi:hypothetical protein
MKAPIIILFARILTLLLWSAVIYCYVLGNGISQIITTKTAIISFIFLVALMLSFLRCRMCLWALAIFWIGMPMCFWISFNTSGIVHGTWWEWLLVFPVQMALPFALSYALLTDKAVHNYFSPSKPLQ